jgi:cytochrome c oxidase subunit 2
MTSRATRSRRAALTQLCALAGLGLLGSVAPAQEPAPRIVEIEARRFKYTPDRVVLKRGEAVVIAFHSIDFVHGFNVPDLGIRADLLPGQITRVPLRPTAAGNYAFLCDNFCGDGHETMSGVFVVEG